jgi:hypothetical protein
MKIMHTRFLTPHISILLLGIASATWIAASVYHAASADDGASKKDESASRAAFLEAYKVFMHPRCMNCHPVGDAPLQGDDSHVHTQNVQRGPEGHGKYALKCGNCHQDTNLAGVHMPPGNPKWALTTPQMPMVFQGRTPHQLALQLKDPGQNGHRNLEEIYDHVAHDELVGWGWNPGDGRTKPPLTRDEFAKKMREWIDNGAAAPE